MAGLVSAEAARQSVVATWLRNVPVLYDVMLKRTLEWPSLTVQSLRCAENIVFWCRALIFLETHAAHSIRPSMIRFVRVLRKRTRFVSHKERERAFGGRKPDVRKEMCGIRWLPAPTEQDGARAAPLGGYSRFWAAG